MRIRLTLVPVCPAYGISPRVAHMRASPVLCFYPEEPMSEPRKKRTTVDAVDIVIIILVSGLLTVVVLAAKACGLS